MSNNSNTETFEPPEPEEMEPGEKITTFHGDTAHVFFDETGEGFLGVICMEDESNIGYEPIQFRWNNDGTPESKHHDSRHGLDFKRWRKGIK